MSEDEWKDKLTPEQYQVCRCSATEPPFDNEYWDCKKEGKYHCVCCDEILFESEHKFDSGTGWPSFFKPANDSIIGEKEDNSYGMRSCLLYTSPSPRDKRQSRMPSSA